MTPWTIAGQTPLSMEFSVQEYWSGLPFPSPGDLSNPGIQRRSPALQAVLYHLSHQRSPIYYKQFYILLSRASLIAHGILNTGLQYSLACLVAQTVKDLPAMWETWVRSLGWEDPLEKGKATHSSILVWRIPWTV